VISTNAFIAFLVPFPWHAPLVGFTLGLAFSVIMVLSPRIRRATPPRLTLWVPLGFHGFFLLAGMLSGALFQHLTLILMSVGMAIISLFIHRRTLFG
jgi:hypothetical protein